MCYEPHAWAMPCADSYLNPGWPFIMKWIVAKCAMQLFVMAFNRVMVDRMMANRMMANRMMVNRMMA